MASQKEWPRGRETNGTERGSQTAWYRAPGVWERSDRQMAGPLRTGTEPRVGPRAQGPRDGDRSYTSDMGMDRVDPRCFDPLGTSLKRYSPEGIPSSLVTSELGRNRR